MRLTDKICLLSAFLIMTVSGCKKQADQKSDKEIMDKDVTAGKGSFAYDAAFLKKWDNDLVILESGASRVAISARYQAKVFTSAASGDSGKSMGWVNYEAFGKTDPHMNAYGGENRFWLGPEGNVFSLYFKPGDDMVFDHWKTPAAIDTEPWKIRDRSHTSITMTYEMKLQNYSGHEFNIGAEREIKLLQPEDIEKKLRTGISGLKAVGYRTRNKITNTGEREWNRDTGAPCIWILDMFPPSENTTIIIPYKTDARGKVATTDYFGPIPDERIKYKDGLMFFKADGKSRGKLGLPPGRATSVAGSYNADHNILTITVFDVDPDATYLNQEWSTEPDPFAGDAINAYNDGPLEDGSQMGPFYEIESVSPAAFLSDGESLLHTHSVFHFEGDPKAMDMVAQDVFGITLQEITDIF